MGILGKIAWPFKKVGLGFKWLFSKYDKEILASLENYAAGIVLDLMSSDKPGSARFEEALSRLKIRAVKDGLKIYNHVLQRLIEKRVTQAHGDDLEKILDAGLQMAIDVVKAVDLTNLVGDKERRDEAVGRLAYEAKKQGKEWLNVPHILHILIQYAVSSVRAGG